MFRPDFQARLSGMICEACKIDRDRSVKTNNKLFRSVIWRPALAEGAMAKKLTSEKATKNKVAKAKTTPAPTKSTTITLEETFRQLKSLGNAGVRAQNAKRGAGDNQFGVKLGDLRILANKIKTNHELALSLWKTGNIDA